MERGIIKCKDHAQWIKMRKKYLGEPLYNASEMAAYVGDSPYKSAHQAWLEKTGQVEPADLSDNPNILRGIEREPYIRQAFIEENDSWAKFTYRQYDIYIFQNGKKYCIGATLDLEAEVISEENPYGLKVGEHFIAEFKSVKVTPQTFNNDNWIDSPPVYYIEQQYGQLMATGYTANILVAEFEYEDEDGEVQHELKKFAPIIVDPSRLFDDPNVKALDERLTKFAECVRTGKAPDKNIQGTDTEITFKADVSLGSFDDNVEEVKEAVALAVQAFKDLEVSADNEKEGKTAKAKLNKVRKSIEEKRLEVCRQWDEPKNAFNAKCKEVVAIVDGAIKSIDDQLKAIEDNRIAEKKKTIAALQSAILAECFCCEDNLLDYFTQCGGVTYDVRWENRTYAKSAIEKDIKAQIDQFKADFSSMEVFNKDTELYNAMLMAYKRTRRLVDALSAKTELENAREIAKRAKEERETREAQKVQDLKPEPPKPAENHIIEQSSQPITEQLYTIGFEVLHATKNQLAELSTYLKSRGISYKRISVIREN